MKTLSKGQCRGQVEVGVRVGTFSQFLGQCVGHCDPPKQWGLNAIQKQ